MADVHPTTPDDILRRVHGLVSGGRRALLGVTGPPGAGKTTFADALADLLRDRPPVGMGVDWVARVPMDGFHLADCELTRLGRRDRKGAPDTFDVAGYVSLLERLAHDGEEIVYAPAFERDIEQPVAGSIPVAAEARCVITEGNYLLLDGGGWNRVRASLNEVWYLDLDEQERQRRLVARHEQFGKSGSDARAWALGSDQRNAEVVRNTDVRADLRLSSDVLGRSRVKDHGARVGSQP